MVSTRRAALASASTLLLSSLYACSQTDEPATQLILVTDTDVDRIDAVEFRIEAKDVPAKSARATRPADGSPMYLSLLREQGPLGPLTISARGLSGSTLLVARTHVVSFVAEQTLVVPLHLSRNCVNRNCPDTCSELGCVPSALEQESLAPWSGAPPSLAGGPLTQCAGAGMVDLTSDPAHCGSCDQACTVPPGLPHTVATCTASTCGTSCEALWGNCDARPGCEQRLTDMRNCGECGKECTPAQRCETGVCVQK